MNQILNYLQSEQQTAIDTLERWVNHDSPTPDKAAVDSMGQMLVEDFTGVGAELVATHPQPEVGDHYTLSYGGGQAGQILVLCHFDTVWPPGESQKRPFTIANGRATGPGVHDMKGGLLIGLLALRALNHFGLEPRHKLTYLLTSDEEISSPTSRELIEAEGRQSQYCLVLEGSHNASRLTTWRKGVGRFRLEAQGISAHAGVEPEKGVSAIEELAHQIQALHSLSDFERGISVNVGVISGGERPNVVAQWAEAEIDLRVMNRLDGERISEQILGLSPHLSGCELRTSGHIHRWPFEETPAGLALFEKARQIAEKLGFSVEKTGSGGGSDGNLVAALGVPTLDGMGSLGGGAHALTEYTVLEALPLRAAMMAELILAL